MRFRWLLFLILLAAALLTASPPAHAQGQYVSGSITVADAGTCSTASAFVLMNLSGGSASVAINVSGTFSATLSFVTTVDTAAHYTAVNAYPPNSTTAVTSTTGAGTWTVSVPGMASLCVYASAYASGTAVVAMRSTAAISASTRGGGGSGGSGTVSGQANGVIPLGTTATSITQQSHLDDGVTTASTIHSSENLSVAGSGTFTGGVIVPADGVHPSSSIMVGNTTLPALSSNQFALFGPPAATFTSWSLQVESTIPATTDLFSASCTGTNCLLHDTGIPSTAIPNANLAHSAVTVNGSTCTLGSTCTPLPTVPLATGSSTGNTLAAPIGYFICTAACTVTPPIPAAGYEFCVMNDDNVSSAITLGAAGTGVRYENTARTAYGTATTGTLVSSGAVADKICIVGRDATHYLTITFNGTWTAS